MPKKGERTTPFGYKHNMKVAHLARKARLRQYVAELKLAEGCIDCGYNTDSRALEYDHLPGSEKVDDISSLVSGLARIELIMAEIAKCEVVCANCHQIRTDERRKARIKIVRETQHPLRLWEDQDAETG